MKKFTKDKMDDARIKLNNLLTGVAGSNTVFDINQQMDILEAEFTKFDERGEFDDQERVSGGWNTERKNEAEKKDQRDEVFYVHVVVARAGLRLLQQAIPAIKEIADRCLELAGKDAIRQACTAPTVNGKVQTAEFVLPAGYETLTQKIKSAIGG